MIFVKNIKTPANTPQSAALVTEIPIILGKITLVSVQFPPGCNALAHLQINYGLYQLFPSNQDADFATGGETIAWDEELVITAEPAQLTVRTWNEDGTYDHTLSVRVVMQPPGGAQSASQAIQQIFALQASSQS